MEGTKVKIAISGDDGASIVELVRKKVEQVGVVTQGTHIFPRSHTRPRELASRLKVHTLSPTIEQV
jgi:hypothetical protein